jgi:hypothetical protein
VVAAQRFGGIAAWRNGAMQLERYHVVAWQRHNDHARTKNRGRNPQWVFSKSVEPAEIK